MNQVPSAARRPRRLQRQGRIRAASFETLFRKLLILDSGFLRRLPVAVLTPYLPVTSSYWQRRGFRKVIFLVMNSQTRNERKKEKLYHRLLNKF